MKNKGKFKVGRVSDFAKRKGWFFGQFADDALLQSDDVEVSWQNISNKKASPEDKHFHTSSVEINIVISGTACLTIAGKDYKFNRGDFWIIWPETIVENVEADKDTELIVIRAPSVNDKVKVEI